MESTTTIATTSHLSTEPASAKSRGRWLGALGVGLFTGPLWGMAGTVAGMVRAFRTLAENQAASAEALSQNIGFAMLATALGIVVGIVGAVLILVALFVSKNRENWFFWSSVILAGIWCLALFPYGLIVGLPVAFFMVRKRSEFRGSTTA